MSSVEVAEKFPRAAEELGYPRVSTDPVSQWKDSSDLETPVERLNRIVRERRERRDAAEQSSPFQGSKARAQEGLTNAERIV